MVYFNLKSFSRKNLTSCGNPVAHDYPEDNLIHIN